MRISNRNLLKALIFLMIRRPPRSTPKPSSAASDVYKRQVSRWVPVKVDSVKVAKKPSAKKSSRLKPCKPGQVRNPKTNRCKKM